ncbi:hypothetical protein TNIN_481791 [Trichonephila inaurata madagascariensis]|uniref:Uncharacterized protein n=1 Tax=Trichonephila inaurata madagascariensis TaxID=2747483 RepID=A0A8X6X2P2_9ARAC|nr:hypothetical protein TNIN_481791 [Trichonephila inaurata madagascariensis]
MLHVNPADLVSRGLCETRSAGWLRPRVLPDSDLWWKRPPFLESVGYQMVSTAWGLPDENEYSSELKASVTSDIHVLSFCALANSQQSLLSSLFCASVIII